MLRGCLRGVSWFRGKVGQKCTVLDVLGAILLAERKW